MEDLNKNDDNFKDVLRDKISILDEEIEKQKELGQSDDGINLYEQVKKLFEKILNEPTVFDDENEKEDEEVEKYKNDNSNVE